MAAKHKGVLTNVAGTIGSTLGTIAAKTDELKRLLTKRQVATKTPKRAIHGAGNKIVRRPSPKRDVRKGSRRHRSGRPKP